MQMEFKPDWEEARQRHEAYWQREIIDRACLQITAPRSNPPVRCDLIPPPRTLEEQWLDFDAVLDRAEQEMQATFFGGEAFPVFLPNLGPDVFAGFLGCDLVFRKDTSWSVPIIEDWDNAPPLRFDRENRWWKGILDLTARAVERGVGRYYVAITDLHGGGDALAALRDPQRLCTDLIEYPERVRELMDFLTPVWFDVFEGIYELLSPRMEGSSSWLHVWSPRRYYPVSCDFICLISPQHFREFILPDLLAEIEWLDHSLFHLDGPGAIRHLDDLLAIDKLHGIQWVPGSGSAPMLQWVPLLRRIQSAKKNLHLPVEPHEIEPLLRELSSRGLMLDTVCTTEEEARELLRRAPAWTHD